MTEFRSAINPWIAFSDLFAGLMLFFVSAFLVETIKNRQDLDKIRFSAELVRAMNVATKTTATLKVALEGSLSSSTGLDYSETEVSIPSAALFKSLQYDDFLSDPAGRDLLTSIGTALIKALDSAGSDQRFLRVIIEGHTDSDPIRSSAATLYMPTNWELSGRRASGVLRFFDALGLDASRYNVLSMGLADTKPIAPNSTEAGKARNRRIVIRLEPDITSILAAVRSSQYRSK
jgi:flagellar motor protein MotB